MDPAPDPLLLRKSVSAGNRTRDFWIRSKALWPLDHRGGPVTKIRVLILLLGEVSSGRRFMGVTDFSSSN
jgi:hypothetical protein